MGSCKRLLVNTAKSAYKWSQKVETEFWALGVVGYGIFLVILSVFTVRWRVDDIGTQEMTNTWKLAGGFDGKQYGLLNVYARNSQSWTTVTRNTCDWMTYSMVAGYVQAVGVIASSGGSGMKCAGSESCGTGFSDHMSDRCVHYDKIQTVNIALLVITFSTVLVSVSGLLLACLGSLKRMGGISFGLIFTSSSLMLIMSCAWRFITASSFEALGKSAWYPYPEVAVGYYMHINGTLLVLGGISVFGWLVLPVINAYDPEQAKIDKRKLKLKKIKMFNRRKEEEAALQRTSCPAYPGYMPQPQQGVQAAPGMHWPAAPQGAQPMYMAQQFPQAQQPMAPGGALLAQPAAPPVFRHSDGGMVPSAASPMQYGSPTAVAAIGPESVNFGFTQTTVTTTVQHSPRGSVGAMPGLPAV